MVIGIAIDSVNAIYSILITWTIIARYCADTIANASNISAVHPETVDGCNVVSISVDSKLLVIHRRIGLVVTIEG